MKEQHTIHGVFLDIHDLGVLLTGPSNIGKSELALSLIERGHRLIADDYVILQKESDIVIGSCPPALQGFLAIRDVGIINVIKLFGQQVFCTHKKLALIIELTPFHEQQTTLFEAYLQGSIGMQDIMNINIPKKSLLVKPNRNLALLIETCVRLQQCKQAGYDASTDFVARQQQLIDSNS